MKTIVIINGPNLNKLGTREPDRYGSRSLADINSQLSELCRQDGYEIDARQTNSEAEMIEWIQNIPNDVCGLVINPAGYTHTSVAIRDALLLVKAPIIEVHLSNLHRREPFRLASMIADIVWGRIEGLGDVGYECAVRAIMRSHQERLIQPS